MKTNHFSQRQNQRAIRNATVRAALEFGIPLHDGKRLLDRKTIRIERKRLQEMLSALNDADRKGGIVVVLEDDSLITTYPLEQ